MLKPATLALLVFSAMTPAYADPTGAMPAISDPDFVVGQFVSGIPNSPTTVALWATTYSSCKRMMGRCDSSGAACCRQGSARRTRRQRGRAGNAGHSGREFDGLFYLLSMSEWKLFHLVRKELAVAGPDGTLAFYPAVAAAAAGASLHAFGRRRRKP